MPRMARIQNTYSHRDTFHWHVLHLSFWPAIYSLLNHPPWKKSEDPSDTDRHLDFGGNKLAEPSGNLSSSAFVWTGAVTVCLYCRCLCVPIKQASYNCEIGHVYWMLLGKWYYRMVSIVQRSTSMKGREVPVQLRYPTMSGSFPLGAVGACARILSWEIFRSTWVTPRIILIYHDKSWYILSNARGKPRRTKKYMQIFSLTQNDHPGVFFYHTFGPPICSPKPPSAPSLPNLVPRWVEDDGHCHQGKRGEPPSFFYKDLKPLITHSSEVQGKIEALGF